MLVIDLLAFVTSDLTISKSIESAFRRGSEAKLFMAQDCNDLGPKVSKIRLLQLTM